MESLKDFLDGSAGQPELAAVSLADNMQVPASQPQNPTYLQNGSASKIQNPTYLQNGSASKPAYLIRLEQLAENLQPGSVLLAERLCKSLWPCWRILPIISASICKLDRARLQVAASKNRQAKQKAGYARAEQLSPERRREIAMLGVAARQRKRDT